MKIVLKNTEMPIVMNGREAEMAEADGVSSEEDEKYPKFSQPDHVKLLLESGRIPDAAMIHAARKRRQLAREMGGDYVPVETKKTETAKSRLVREDDNDASDDERITMEVNTAARDKERRREAFMAAQDEVTGEESDKGEDDEWESQQIRKGVTGAQLAAVQQENLYQQYGVVVPPMALSPAMMIPPEMPQVISNGNTATTAFLQPGQNISMPNMALFQPMKTEIPTPQTISNRLRERLTSLKEVHRRHTLDRDKVTDDLVTLHTDRQRLATEGPALAQRFRFYQELRGYVTDLVECLDEKMPVIANLEQRLLGLLKRRANELIERRRQDVRDQAEEFSPLSKTGVTSISKRTKEEEEQRVRRAAEREGRRTRRRRAREMKMIGRHVEGMSSDDEMTELEVTAFRNQKETIENDARLVFEDVVEEFCTVRGIMKRFESWRDTDPDAYREAYVSLCLPKVLGPVIRLKLLTWNPLQETVEFERHKWYDSLLLYGLRDSETEESLRADPDLKLVPLIVEKVVLPKLHQLIEAQWDPLSTLQTLRLVGLLNKLLQEYPTLGSESKPLLSLMTTVVDKMKATVENDIYIPIYPRQVLETKGSGIGQFFQRQFGSAVKLLRNLLSWQGIVNDSILQQIALSSLLNRYLLAALRTCDPTDAAEKCNMIVSTFPRWWFQQDCSRPQLHLFVNQLKTIAQSLDVNTPSGRESMECLTKILQALQPSSSSSSSTTAS
ncbi:PAX3- and PAX7-binding protein 1 isoform X2 [Anabrus simplex]|uniref:PAX3- and PAX7-binding protein 1 isoform X2 n=1 Tax=Anabrus simplex TaxID=316456 RepID=UPI0035A33992